MNSFHSREVHQYADEVRKELRELLHQKAQLGVRFSVTSDEYTSLKIARYCCVNVHMAEGDFVAVGMVRVTGSLTAERAAEILNIKLAQFDIEDGHIVANTTDGARGDTHLTSTTFLDFLTLPLLEILETENSQNLGLFDTPLSALSMDVICVVPP